MIVGPLHTAAQREEVEEQVEDAVKRGARVLAGGKRPAGEAFAKGNFYLPTLLVDVDETFEGREGRSVRPGSARSCG